MQYGVIIGNHEFTIYCEEVTRDGTTKWEAHIVDWASYSVMDFVVEADTEQSASLLAWLELADEYGTPDTLPPGVSDLMPDPTWADHEEAARKLDELLSLRSKPVDDE